MIPGVFFFSPDVTAPSLLNVRNNFIRLAFAQKFYIYKLFRFQKSVKVFILPYLIGLRWQFVVEGFARQLELERDLVVSHPDTKRLCRYSMVVYISLPFKNHHRMHEHTAEYISFLQGLFRNL